MRLLMTTLAALLYAPPDGGGASPGTGGASPAPSADASVPEGDGGEGLSAEPSAEGEQEPPDDLDAALLDSDDEHADLPFSNHPRFKAIRNKLRTAQRQVAKLRTLRDRVQAIGDLDQVVYDAQNYRRIAPQMESNKHLRALIYGEPADSERDEPDRETPFDEAGYPFERDSDQGKYLYALAREHHDTKAALRAISRDLGAMRQTHEQSTRQAELGTWSKATTAAAAQLPAEQRQMFMDAVYGAYQHAKARGLRVQPQAVIDHYLKGQKVTPAVKQSASAAAARQAMAQRNNQNPRGPAIAGQGRPAPAQKKRMNVFELGKQIRRMSN